MKLLRAIAVPMFIGLWLLGALPGNLPAGFDYTPAQSASAAAQPEDDADAGVPIQQIVGSVPAPRPELSAVVRLPAAARPPAVAQVRVPAPSHCATALSRFWQFTRRAALPPRAPSSVS